jgi:diguanylate cyclase (GGDEF)-like protein
VSLTAKLAISFTVALAIIAAAAATAIRISIDYERTLTASYRDHLLGAVSLSNAMDALWKLRFGLAQFMVVEGERQRIVAEEPKLYAVIEENLKNYAAIKQQQEDKEALRLLLESFRRYTDARPKWFELYGAGKFKEAADWRATTTNRFGTETVAMLEREIHLEQDLARREMQATLDNARASRIFLYSVLAVLAAAMAMIFVLAVRALQPLKALRRKAEDNVRELFGESMEAQGRDEVQTLVGVFERMTQRFISHTKDLTRTREELRQQREGLEQTVGERTSELGRLLAGMEQQTAEAKLFYEIADRLQSCHNVEDASAVLRVFGPKLFPEHAGTLYLTRASRNLLEPAMTWGAQSSQLPFSPEDCWALRRGKLHRVDDVHQELVCAHMDTPAEHPYLCVPLIAQGEAIGLLCLQSSKGAHADAPRAERLSAGAASQIALALGNLRLRETLRTQSLSDPLTGLYNRRFLDDALQREVARAQRSKLPLTVLMVDVDHFKRFNDTFGHEAGDIALRAIGRLLREHFRLSDHRCRYGGEEFTVIMPDAPLEGARKRAEELREAAERLEISQSGQALGPITLSLGLATMPAHGTTPQALLEAADAALYQAKQAGRNRVVVSGTGEP